VGSPSCARSKGQAHGVGDCRPSAPALEVESIHRSRSGVLRMSQIDPLQSVGLPERGHSIREEPPFIHRSYRSPGYCHVGAVVG
jgi:hypothetical protein